MFENLIGFGIKEAIGKIMAKMQFKAPMTWRYGNVIMPVDVIDEWQTNIAKAYTFNLNTGNGNIIGSSDVPSDEEWVVLSVKVGSTTGSTSIQAVKGVVGLYLIYVGTGSILHGNTQMLDSYVWRSGDSLYVGQTSNGADTAIACEAVIVKRKIRA